MSILNIGCSTLIMKKQKAFAQSDHIGDGMAERETLFQVNGFSALLGCQKMNG